MPSLRATAYNGQTQLRKLTKSKNNRITKCHRQFQKEIKAKSHLYRPCHRGRHQHVAIRPTDWRKLFRNYEKSKSLLENYEHLLPRYSVNVQHNIVQGKSIF